MLFELPAILSSNFLLFLDSSTILMILVTQLQKGVKSNPAVKKCVAHKKAIVKKKCQDMAVIVGYW